MILFHKPDLFGQAADCCQCGLRSVLAICCLGCARVDLTCGRFHVLEKMFMHCKCRSVTRPARHKTASIVKQQVMQTIVRIQIAACQQYTAACLAAVHHLVQYTAVHPGQAPLLSAVPLHQPCSDSHHNYSEKKQDQDLTVCDSKDHITTLHPTVLHPAVQHLRAHTRSNTVTTAWQYRPIFWADQDRSVPNTTLREPD
jgi:hypothetical protein